MDISPLSLFGPIKFCRDLWLKYKYGIFVSPSKISVSSEWETIQNIKIVNNNQFPLYAVQVKIYLDDESGKATFSGEWLGTDTLTQRLDSSQNTYAVTLHNLFLQGFDSNNKPWIRIFLQSIDPYCTENYKLIISSVSKETLNRRVNLKITSFSKEPPNILHKEGTLSFPITTKD